MVHLPRRAPLCSFALCALVGASAAATDLVDHSTGTRFGQRASAGGTDFECLGAGVRKIFTFKVYAVTYCVDAERAEGLDEFAGQLHPNLQGEELAAALEKDSRFFDYLASLPGDKLVVMHMVRDVGRDKLADAFRKALKDVLPPDKVERLVGAIPSDAHNGENALLYSSGSKLVIDIAGRQQTIDDSLIAHKLWTVWLGPDSVSPSLKRSLAKNAASTRAVSAVEHRTVESRGETRSCVAET